MLYLGNANSPAVRAAMTAGELGQLCAPGGGSPPVAGALWAADNGCFGKGWTGAERWLAWLRRYRPHRTRCLFATAPDVVGDAAATLARSQPWLPVLRSLGYPAALVAQDGIDATALPWDAFDVLFLGGTTDFKLGPVAAAVTGGALARGKRVHMGRVNSLRRWRIAEAMGCHTVDGTYLAFGPEKNLARLRRWGMTNPPTGSSTDGTRTHPHHAGRPAGAH